MLGKNSQTIVLNEINTIGTLELPDGNLSIVYGIKNSPPEIPARPRKQSQLKDRSAISPPSQTKEDYCRELINIILEIEGIASKNTRGALYTLDFTQREKVIIDAARNENAASETADVMAIIAMVHNLNKIRELISNAILLTSFPHIKEELKEIDQIFLGFNNNGQE